jgi:hypothetical protein
MKEREADHEKTNLTWVNCPELVAVGRIKFGSGM